MSQTKTTNPDVHHRAATCIAGAPLFLCPIIGYPCEGDLSYLCEDYGCARKGGLSPRSDENEILAIVTTSGDPLGPPVNSPRTS